MNITRTPLAGLQKFSGQPKPIIICTILALLSALWLALFSMGAFGGLGMPFFQVIGFPMQIGVIGMGIHLMVRVQRNRPESFIQAVPTAVRIFVPLAVAFGAIQLRTIGTGFPSQSPAGNVVHSFDASVVNGVCTAVFNGTEHVAETAGYCASYQSHFDQIFAAAWLLFSSIELWGAWAIYGAEPVRRIRPDRQRFGATKDDFAERLPAVDEIRPTKPYLWLTVRLAIVAYWLFGGWHGFKESITAPLFLLLVAFAFATLSTRYAIVQAYTSVRRTEPWLLPSWFINPFQRSQPFQFFHLGGLCFLLFGGVGVLHAVIDGQRLTLERWPLGMFAGSFGLGIIVGMYWAISAYRSRFQRVERP